MEFIELKEWFRYSLELDQDTIYATLVSDNIDTRPMLLDFWKIAEPLTKEDSLETEGLMILNPAITSSELIRNFNICEDFLDGGRIRGIEIKAYHPDFEENNAPQPCITIVKK